MGPKKRQNQVFIGRNQHYFVGNGPKEGKQGAKARKGEAKGCFTINFGKFKAECGKLGQIANGLDKLARFSLGLSQGLGQKGQKKDGNTPF